MESEAETRSALSVVEVACDLLDVGSGDGATARALFPNARITRADIDPVTAPNVVYDITTPLPEELALSFDIVLASHVLEHLDRLKVISAIHNIRRALRYGGLAYLIVPSLEWCAREILKDKPSGVLLPVLYGEPSVPHQAHLSGYTMMMLRQIAGMGRLHVREAKQTDFLVNMTGPEGPKSYIAKQNVVVAMRAENDEEEPSV